MTHPHEKESTMHTFRFVIRAAVAAAMICLAGSPAAAGQRAGAVTVSPMIGGYVFDNQQDLEKDVVAGLGLGYNFTEHWGAELMFNYGKFDFEYFDPVTCTCPEDDLDAYILRLDGLYHFRPDKRLVPYLAAGIGNVWLDGDTYPHDDSYFILNYGGGVKFDLTETVALRADVRHIFAPEDSDNNLVATLGVAFQFGGAKKAAPEPEPVAAAPPPAPAPPPPPAPPRTINLQVQFDRDKADIKPIYHARIQEVADFMTAYPDADAVIEGHTCSLGSAAYNMNLSFRRAESVKRYLVDRFGIDPARLETRGYGLTRPIASNATEAGRIQNRRVIAIVVQD